MSTLYVDTITEKTAGNGVQIADLVPAAGSVVQVVQSSSTTQVTSTAAGWVDTGLSASITPSSTSSKIMVTVTQPVFAQRADNEADVMVKILSNHSGSYADIVNVDDAERMIQGYQSGGFSLTTAGAVYAMSKFIAPSTTSSFSVKTQIRFRSAYGSSGDVWAQKSGNEATITLMEIAQ